MNTINEKVDYIEEQLLTMQDPHARIDLMNQLAYELRHTNSNLSIQKSLQAAVLAEKIGYQKGVAAALLNQGFGETVQAGYAAAFQTLHKAAVIFEALQDAAGKAHTLYNVGVVYNRIGEYNQALDSFQQSLVIRRSLGDQKGEANCLNQLAYIYEQFGNTDEALKYYDWCLLIQKQIVDQAGIAATLMAVGIIKQKRHQYAEAKADLVQSLAIRKELGETHGWLVSMNYLGEFYITQNMLKEAKDCLLEALEKATRQIPIFPANLCRLYTSLAKVYIRYEEYKRAILHLEQALQTATDSNLKYQVSDIHYTLSEVYKQMGDYQSALTSYQNYHLCKEEVINLASSIKLKNLELFNQVEDEKRKAEIHRLRNIELKEAYNQLQKAQAQLIQSEKMASLGELTAGIAHEIQNPLNFVNNFSEVNNELITELKIELTIGNIDQAISIALDISENEQKIAHHGKRADAIIKGMLQHSKRTTGLKEMTNINALTDEYLHLSYHGFRAKDKSFNCDIETIYEGGTININIVPQDIGRVLLNLFNNAFYAMNVKKKKYLGEYEPRVSIITKKENDKIEIIIKDNGNGIPQMNIDKIFWYC